MPKRKLIEDFQEEEEFEWDKKKIFLTLGVVIFLLLGGFVAKHFFLGTQTSPASFAKAVQGTSTVRSDVNTASQDIPLPSAGSIQQQLATLKQQVSSLSIKEIASSSPQVQQIIQQIQTIKNTPTNEAKNICEQMCGSVLGK